MDNKEPTKSKENVLDSTTRIRILQKGGVLLNDVSMKWSAFLRRPEACYGSIVAQVVHKN
jgi:hypothetical protein